MCYDDFNARTAINNNAMCNVSNSDNQFGYLNLLKSMALDQCDDYQVCNNQLVAGTDGRNLIKIVISFSIMNIVQEKSTIHNEEFF